MPSSRLCQSPNILVLPPAVSAAHATLAALAALAALITPSSVFQKLPPSFAYAQVLHFQALWDSFPLYNLKYPECV